MLFHTDDTLVIKNSESMLRDMLDKNFELNQDSIGPPNKFLVRSVIRVALYNGVDSLVLRSSQHMGDVVYNAE